MQNLESSIKEIIYTQVEQAKTTTRFRKPVVGFASATDPLFDKIKELIGPHHLHPTEVLPEAKTVIAYFLPFAEDIVNANRKAAYVAREWSVAYIEGNKVINTISEELQKELAKAEIQAATQPATHNFNEQDLTAMWSHKSAAFVAGLGRFGLNRMLITPEGCAGRFGSIVISAEIQATPRPIQEYCHYLKGKKCVFCVNSCPTGALTVENLDKKKCYQRLLEVDKSFPDLGLCDVCGKCAIGPCAY